MYLAKSPKIEAWAAFAVSSSSMLSYADITIIWSSDILTKCTLANSKIQSNVSFSVAPISDSIESYLDGSKSKLVNLTLRGTVFILT